MTDLSTANSSLRSSVAPTGCRRRGRVAVTLLAVALLAGASLLLSGCGDSDSVTPESLADDIVQTWSQSMEQLVALIEDEPEASSVMSEVQTLKESTIQSLVALGHQRETLTEGEQAEVDSLEWAALKDTSEETWYTSYNELWSYYNEIDLEFANLIAEFNTLGQYSDFELLRQQLPDEAARLGVE